MYKQIQDHKRVKVLLNFHFMFGNKGKRLTLLKITTQKDKKKFKVNISRQNYKSLLKEHPLEILTNQLLNSFRSIIQKHGK